MTTIRLITRKSPLAVKQSELVKAAIHAVDNDLEVEIIAISTQADRMHNMSLAEVGGKGLFVKELEQALIDGKADVAVHSVKDIPALLPDKLSLAAVLKREDPRDVLVSNKFKSLSQLPAGSVIGTSSLRRHAQLKRLCQEWQIEPIRGNLQTRLRKLREGPFDALVLAAAGLLRMDMADKIVDYIETSQMLPASGQGVIGMEIHENCGFKDLLREINHAETYACISAERAVVKGLGGDCRLPIAAFAQIEAKQLKLKALVSDPNAEKWFGQALEGKPKNAESLGTEVAVKLVDQGADKVLAEIKADPSLK